MDEIKIISAVFVWIDGMEPGVQFELDVGAPPKGPQRVVAIVSDLRPLLFRAGLIHLQGVTANDVQLLDGILTPKKIPKHPQKICRCVTNDPNIMKVINYFSRAADNRDGLRFEAGVSLPDSLWKEPRLQEQTPYTTHIQPSSCQQKQISSRNNRSSSTFLPRIRCVVRKRPLNKNEIQKHENDIVTVGSQNSLSVHELKAKVDPTQHINRRVFRFDQIFDENTNNEVIYRHTAQPLVQSIFQGGKALCFVYGQTGSGKTYTMMGENQDGTGIRQEGIYRLAGCDILNTLSSPAYCHARLHASISFFEIIGEKLFDLLGGRKKLEIVEDCNQSVVITDLKEIRIGTVEDLMNAVSNGNETRSKGSVSANADSSRAHTILRISIKNRQEMPVGCFSFVDLAGSEQGANTPNSDWQTRMESALIRMSLVALKECIRALDQHLQLSFRDSKLTMVLKDSFVGDAHVVMIANVSPNSSSCENTLNTLCYAGCITKLKQVDDHIVCNNSGNQDVSGLLNTNINHTDPFPAHTPSDSASFSAFSPSSSSSSSLSSCSSSVANLGGKKQKEGENDSEGGCDGDGDEDGCGGREGRGGSGSSGRGDGGGWGCRGDCEGGEEEKDNSQAKGLNKEEDEITCARKELIANAAEGGQPGLCAHPESRRHDGDAPEGTAVRIRVGAKEGQDVLHESEGESVKRKECTKENPFY